MMRVGSMIAGLALLLGAAACGADDGPGLSGAEGAGTATTAGPDGEAADGGSDLTLPEEVVPFTGDPADVVALDNSFNAEGISVPAGTTVRWVNNGRQDHDIVPGGTYEHTFTAPGTYNYYCTLHGTESAGMVGVVVVE